MGYRSISHVQGACRRVLLLRPAACICLLLAGLTLAVYAQTRAFEFVSLDDGLYVTENPRVKAGVTREGVAWSFGFESKRQTYWHPLTWLSHMLDVEFFGMAAGGHHLTNVCLHLVNTLLLFALLLRLTGAPWRSAAVAAVFAVHPLNVESVAWVAARKNLLSTVFWLLALHVHAGYARRGGALRYGLLALVFAAGLLAKPMLVTLPATLLLIDYWPLGRLPGLGPRTAAGNIEAAERDRRGSWGLVIEKLPLLGLSVLVAWLALGSVKAPGAAWALDAVPVALRLQNALVSCGVYILKLIWPSDLAMFYPYPQSIPLWQIVCAALALAAVTAFAVIARRERPYLIVGWLWFLGTLLPVSGILQAGLWPAWADRWAYVPSIGLLLILVWGAGDLAEKLRPRSKAAAAALALAGLAALVWAGHRQTGVWANDLALYRNAIEKVGGNFFAMNNLAEALYRQGRLGEAGGLFAGALAAAPFFAPAHVGMANTLLALGEEEKALHHYREALRLSPGDKAALNNLGVLHLQAGRTAEAVDVFQQALAADEEYSEAHNNLGFVYLRTGRAAEAERHLAKALALDPENRMARENMAELHSARPSL